MSADFFFKIKVSENSFKNSIIVSNSLYSDQAQHSRSKPFAKIIRRQQHKRTERICSVVEWGKGGEGESPRTPLMRGEEAPPLVLSTLSCLWHLMVSSARPLLNNCDGSGGGHNFSEFACWIYIVHKCQTNKKSKFTCL